MKKALFLIYTVLLFIGCEKEEEIQKQISDGVYTGTYQRQIIGRENKTSTANITLIFKGNKWSGSNNYEKHPALCAGTYSLNEDTIVFENDCPWTIDFDHFLILGGKYLLTKKENTLEFTKKYPSATATTAIDKYVLKKQE